MTRNRAKTYKKLALGSLVAALLSFGAFRVTKALYSDYEQIQNNQISSVSVDLEVTGEDPNTLSFNIGNLAPGISQRQTFTLADQSSLVGVKNFYWEAVLTEDSEGENAEAETDTEGEGELDECVMMQFSYLDPTLVEEVIIAPYAIARSYNGVDLDQTVGSAIDQALATEPVEFIIDFNADACGNEAMGDYFNMDLNLFYVQQ